MVFPVPLFIHLVPRTKEGPLCLQGPGPSCWTQTADLLWQGPSLPLPAPTICHIWHESFKSILSTTFLCLGQNQWSVNQTLLTKFPQFFYHHLPSWPSHFRPMSHVFEATPLYWCPCPAGLAKERSPVPPYHRQKTGIFRLLPIFQNGGCGFSPSP